LALNPGPVGGVGVLGMSHHILWEVSMKIIISENERGFRFKHGIYQGMIMPGRQNISKFFGETYVLSQVYGRVNLDRLNLPTLRKDPIFTQSTKIIEVPENHLAIRFEDGCIREILEAGTYAYWTIHQDHRFELLDMTDPDAAGTLPIAYMRHIPAKFCLGVSISEGEAGALFFDGAYQRTLGPGQYFFWRYYVSVTVRKVDMRLQQVEIPGQEILTADKVGLRINFVCGYKITDPLSAVTKLTDYTQQIYVHVQMALRALVGKYRLDEILRQKDSIGGQVLTEIKAREAELYVQFESAGVKDIILPGEIRDIMNTVLIAEKSAQASVITRREETAATKSLLETAKLMDENTTLYKLKELEYLERICEKIGNISVDSGGGVVEGLRRLLAGGGQPTKEV